MKLLEDRIRQDGIVAAGDILRVDSFLNHQIDIGLMDVLAGEFYRLFYGNRIDKVVTVEASGIAVAAFTARKFNVPLVFAKKAKTLNISSDYYVADCYSYTHAIAGKVMISKNYLNEGEHVLIIDDFLANGQATLSLLNLCEQAGAIPVGVGIMVEKSYQPGRGYLEEKGIRVESLARVASMDPETGVHFVGE